MGHATAEAARDRLRADRLTGPVRADRARLAILSARLDRAARTAVAAALSTRVRGDPRLAPLLGQLMRQSLGS